MCVDGCVWVAREVGEGSHPLAIPVWENLEPATSYHSCHDGGNFLISYVPRTSTKLAQNFRMKPLDHTLEK